LSGQDDLKTSLRAIMAARLEELGGPPTPEELLAFRDGGLSPEERERMAARIAAAPDAACALADLAAFPDVEPAPGVPELSDDDLAAGWLAFRQRLPDRAPSPPAEAVREAAPAPVRPAVFQPSSPARQRWAPALRLAAGILFGIVVGWGAGRTGREDREVRVASGPAINPLVIEISPDSAGLRSAPEVIELPADSEALVLTLGSDGRDERDFPSYEAEGFDESGRQVWKREGLRPTAIGTFGLSFSREAIKPGYRIDLYGRDRGERQLLATYSLKLLEAAPAP
jgi:anti-sigma factor RsiW